jgi:ribose transport system substrate-binding protein
MEATVIENPDVTEWFIAGLWPLLEGRGAMPTWEQLTLAGQLYNVGFDTLPVQLDLMEDGYLHGLVGQKYWGWGYDSVTMIYEHIINGVEYDSFTDSGLDIVTPLNLPAMKLVWATCNFSIPLPDPFERDPENPFDANAYTNACPES